MKTVKELMALKDKIEQNKAERNKLQGKLSALMDRLEKDYKALSLDAAKAILKTLQADAKSQETEILKDVKKLEGTYGL